MKKLSLIFLSAVAAFAVDYSAMSTEELRAARGSVAEADRSAFQGEMQSRMQTLSPEERQAESSNMRQSKSGTQDGSGSQMRQGGGGGGGKQYRGGR
ncbi:hypothetical protein [Sulfurimonas sp.]|jgi:hypothetical protein|uniref:hypothetical protein n=1 Tax=Sulfurimonas sp. TaxID=2022749 RepID=UPI0025FA7753|nr:hypothetical protein [Sulfurimonas sp.]MCK9472848.1 hypothetical protein [Sulfurimonas sp.]MDD3505187.1 hypothetical protein [Sulfurimonas sp.]